MFKVWHNTTSREKKRLYFGKLNKANTAIYYDFLGEKFKEKEKEIVNPERKDKAIYTACEGEIYSLAACIDQDQGYVHLSEALQTAHLKSSQINQFRPHTAAAVEALSFNKFCLLLYLIG